jgi:hypothetical protein
MFKTMSLCRVGLLGLVGLSSFAGLAIALGSVNACASLSDTTVVPDGAAIDYDGGAIPSLEDAGGGTTPPPTTEPPPSGRVRLANLLEGDRAIDVCARLESPASSPWIANLVSDVQPFTKPGGVSPGEVSGHKFLNAAPGAGTRYVFRVIPVGGSCDSPDSPPIASIPATAIRQGGGLTLVAFGVATGVDAGDANPRAAAIADEVNPVSNAARVRVFHAIPDMAAFDLVINGETVATGVKYGGASAFPYSSTSGFVGLAAGIPDGARLTLRAGTNVRSYTVPERVRRGVAMTFFAYGRIAAPVVSLCSDRTPPEGTTVAECTRLKEIAP